MVKCSKYSKDNEKVGSSGFFVISQKSRNNKLNKFDLSFI